MAKVANAYTTYAAKGNREDLSDQIYNIDPFDTPIFNSLGRRDATNRTYDWQTENLPAVDGDNAKQEGFELNRAPGQPTIRQMNVTQISSRDATVSGSQEAARAAGRPSEMGAQMALKSKALKRDMEVIIASSQPMNLGDDSASPVPRRTRGLIHWLKTNILMPVKSGAPVITLPASATATYPVIAAADRVEFKEPMLNMLMEMAYGNGAEPNLLFAPPKLKRTISGFKGRDSTQVLVGKTEVTNTVDIYVSDFGRIKVLPTRWIDLNTVLLIDPNYARVAYYRTLRSIQIAKIGDAETRMILAEWGLEVGNEAAHGALLGMKAPTTIDDTTVTPPA